MIFFFKFLLTSVVFIGCFQTLSGSTVSLGADVKCSTRCPLEVIIVDGKGEVVEKTLIFDPILGGVDIKTNLGGSNVSVFFPEYSIGYLWNDGFWVDQEGYYWDRGLRVSVGASDWNTHWVNYWDQHWKPSWNRYWKERHFEHGWRYRNNEKWSDHWDRQGEDRKRDLQQRYRHEQDLKQDREHESIRKQAIHEDDNNRDRRGAKHA